MTAVAALLTNLYEDIPSDIKNICVNHITLNSAKADKQSLFIALKGQHVDGRDFIESCPSFIVFAQSNKNDIKISHERIVFFIKDLPEKVSLIAGRFYHNPSRKIRVTGFTGTNGKTTCAYLYAQLVAQLHGACGHVGTLGQGVLTCENDVKKVAALEKTGMTTPSPIDCQKILSSFCDKAQYASMEVSSHALAQHRVKNIFFSGAAFTNLSRDHLDYHKTMQDYFKAKLSLFTEHSIEFAVVNLDDQYGQIIIDALNNQPEKKIKTCGFTFGDNQSNHVDYLVVVKSTQYTAQGINTTIQIDHQSYMLTIPLVGEYNLANVLTVVACAYMQGFDIHKISHAVSKFTPVAGRLERVTTSTAQPTVFVDFAHTPDAVAHVIKELRALCHGKLWVVLGCGGDRDKGKRPLMAKAALHADVCVFTTDNPRSESPDAILDDMFNGLSARNNVYRIVDRKKAITFAVQDAHASDMILIAGKGHETHQIIGDTPQPFNDMLVAKEALLLRSSHAHTLGVPHAK